jgi:hypothetical protein
MGLKRELKSSSFQGDFLNCFPPFIIIISVNKIKMFWWQAVPVH